jgi:predicted P-loop ATPase
MAAELQRVGVASPDVAVLEAEWSNADPHEFILGLDWMARCYMDQRAPKAAMPKADPWAELAEATHKVPPGDVNNAILSTLASRPPATQAAVYQAIMARSDMIQIEQQKVSTRRRQAASQEYLDTLTALGYSFRQNELNDIIEVNGHPINDSEAALIRRQMRDAGFEFVNVMEDTYTSEAFIQRFNPVRDYFTGLAWDGQPHIANMAQYFNDKDGAFPLFVRRWLIGAVAKALSGAQNRMLVLNGTQGLGKGWWCKWLCKGIGSHYYVESSINPDDKDAMIRLASKFIWEVSELGATTRRADVESLKNFLTLEQITIRRPYGKYDMIKPALASFVGTINDQKGFLTDPTGNRRFMTVSLSSIAWDYYTDLDPNQVWAEAHAAFLAGETWNLQPDEFELAEQINEAFEVEDPIEGLLKRYFIVDATKTLDWTPTIDILMSLEENGLKGQTRAHAMELSKVMTKLGIERAKRPNPQGQRVWGYVGVRRI